MAEIKPGAQKLLDENPDLAFDPELFVKADVEGNGICVTPLGRINEWNSETPMQEVVGNFFDEQLQVGFLKAYIRLFNETMA